MTIPPQPLPPPPAVPEPEDRPYCGALQLSVDATDVIRRILRARQTIPVSGAGPMILLHPKWLPGFHAPQAPIELLAGLELSAGGEKIVWKRHPVTVNAFHVDVPEGVDRIEAEFQFLSPTDASQGRVIATPEMLMLPWNAVVLYPAGHFARQIAVDASITLPDGWDFASALEVKDRQGSTCTFERVALDVLVDSPLMAARHFRKVKLDATGDVRLNIAADRPELLEANDAQLAPHRAVVEQCDRLFGARHFRHYDVLLALSEELSTAGIEHHQSCEAVSIPNYFTEWDTTFARRDTFPHEYVHSWNGKHRRGADSWAPCFETPIRNSLMWVYEGQTQYWSRVLCARAGLWTLDQALGALANTAATYDIRPGSRWRPMIDTTRDPIIAARAPLPWKSWQRSEDYYAEGALMWLDIDTRIRALRDDRRSLDDFARAFFGPDGMDVTNTYVFEDVVDTLRQVADYDWKAYFEREITETHEHAPLGGLQRGGYELVFQEKPSAFAVSATKLFGTTDLSFSIGLTTDAQGHVSDVLWEGPAFDQGLTAGSSILGINNRAFSVEELDAAIARTSSGDPLELLVKSGQQVRTIAIDYAGGSRYPHLVPIAGARRRLEEILTPRD